jgi:hypothetical protein
MTPEPMFALDISLAIGITLATLGAFLLMLVFLMGRCTHAWLLRYDVEQKRAYLSCRHCNAKTQGWQYGTSHDKDAA